MTQIIIIKKGMTSMPCFACYRCSNPIDRGSEANLVWNPDNPTNTRIYCRECDRLMLGDHEHGYSMELDVMWHYLKINTGIDPQDAKRKADLLENMI
jgi:hypothetical protein